METNFFTSFLMGGLGNQMFQISHAYAQGLKHKTKVIFKPTAYTPMQANKPDKYFDNIYRKIKFDNLVVNYIELLVHGISKKLYPLMEKI